MAATALAAPAAEAEGGMVGADRRWAMRWAFVALLVFVAFALCPPVYMLLTALKTSSEVSAASNPWWVFNPTLANFAGPPACSMR